VAKLVTSPTDPYAWSENVRVRGLERYDRLLFQFLFVESVCEDYNQMEIPAFIHSGSKVEVLMWKLFPNGPKSGVVRVILPSTITFFEFVTIDFVAFDENFRVRHTGYIEVELRRDSINCDG